jgi:hypothetical protein
MSSPEVGDANASDEVKLGVFWLARPGSETGGSASASATATAPENPLVVSVGSAGKTVVQLKQELEARIPGGPLVAGQTLIWRGRRLHETEQLLEVVKEQQDSVRAQRPLDDLWIFH